MKARTPVALSAFPILLDGLGSPRAVEALDRSCLPRYPDRSWEAADAGFDETLESLVTNPEPSNNEGGDGAIRPVIAVVGVALVVLSLPIWWLVQNFILSDSTSSTRLETAATTTLSTSAPVPTTTAAGQITTTATVFGDTTRNGPGYVVASPSRPPSSVRVEIVRLAGVRPAPPAALR